MCSLLNNRERIESRASKNELKHPIKFLEKVRFFYLFSFFPTSMREILKNKKHYMSIKLSSLLMIRNLHNSCSCHIRSTAFNFELIGSKLHEEDCHLSLSCKISELLEIRLQEQICIEEELANDIQMK